VLTAGYGDGFIRACSNRGTVLVHGRRCPILGRVSMDLTVVDLTAVPGEVQCGDPVVLVGRQEGAEITLAEYAGWAGTIPWEALTGVTKRAPRLYRGAAGA
jgi:alanine racemase